MKSSQDWVKQLNLEPHPEGGYYRRIYESLQSMDTPSGKRHSATAIHYLLEANDFSAWHKIKQDELWFYHAGATLTVHHIDPLGKIVSQQLGANDDMSITIAANTWFCAEITQSNSPQDYSLVSCVVSPGFDFEDFELGHAKQLSKAFPQHEALIKRLCRE